MKWGSRTICGVRCSGRKGERGGAGRDAGIQRLDPRLRNPALRREHPAVRFAASVLGCASETASKNNRQTSQSPGPALQHFRLGIDPLPAPPLTPIDPLWPSGLVSLLESFEEGGREGGRGPLMGAFYPTPCSCPLLRVPSLRYDT